MKRLIETILVASLVLITLSGCSSTSSYSEEVEAQRALVSDYFARNNYVVINELPEDTVFAANEFYHYPNNGIYIQILDKGEGDTLRTNDEIVLRYIEYSMDLTPVVVSFWTTEDRPYPNTIFYGSTTNSCEGWQTAFELMKRSGSVANVIVPSKLGLNSSIVKTYLYHMEIKRLPN